MAAARARVLACALLAAAVGAPAAQPAAVAAPWARSCSSVDTAGDALAGIDLAGRVLVYTGADGSLASASTLELARANASLILACRRASKCAAVLQSLASRSGTSAALEAEALDLSSAASIRAFASRVTTRHKRIDVLVNSAGSYDTSPTEDGLVGAMQVNLLGPALLTELLLPALRGHGRVVNVAAAAYGTRLAANTTAADLAALCTSVDPRLNRTGGYFALSKFLMVHHAVELARREPTVAAVALAPGVAFRLPDVPNWAKYAVMHFPYPDWVLQQFPAELQKFIKVCSTNEARLRSCPETQEQGAAVIVAAAAWPEVESHSGVYLDFETKQLPDGAPNVYGPWTQSDPTCMPRRPGAMDPRLRSDWYDEMLRLMGSGSSTHHGPGARGADSGRRGGSAHNFVV
ncbi:unnamed protein product [Prorocentrum cordatum]|uniref:Protochlorophyllide reductase n=1 Tax=Prorocentrum cordatum TaxID=2364126 RepID=A0ABN9QFJ6_9DINO|nr:unnamed protein product [Polarella glacialis]